MDKKTLPRGKWMSINGLELHYLDWGGRNNPSILLLHGFLSNAHIWDNFASHGDTDCRMIALDQRGHGHSGWSSDGAYGIDDHFADLVEFIDGLDFKEVILVGHSMGGRNALFLTACCPEKIRGLILVDARPGNSEDSIRALKHLIDRAKMFAVSQNSIYPGGQISSPICANPYDPCLISGVESAAYRVESLWPFMGSVSCPTLIIRGENSTFVSRKEAERMCHIIPHSQMVEIPGASHLPMVDQPALFGTAISSFIKMHMA